ncbi:hypothetical protein [Streptomyces sp. UNOB3_S3]|uniref:hypothetical protein n=1 Tax=Streptomyces sp. UNOB3_S3 TaxID=2871682 RepID=UPI001E5C981E|nr:hypothetical protein [Streptomyces sp. UNOB3_S3]MCC3777509.1 hypothetical protein [Streptomyces sp. UNOB3_S3]
MDPTMDISVMDGRDPDTDTRLTEELFAGLPVPVPDLADAGGQRPAWLVVARQPDGGLLGWAEAYEQPDGIAEADLLWLVASRERERIVQGHNVTREVTPEDQAVALRLVRGAADHARATGYTALYWDDPEGHLGAQAHAELGVAEHEELGRYWTVKPLITWTAPAGLPPVTVRTALESPEGRDLAAYADFYTAVTGQPHSPEDTAELLTDLPSLPQVTLDLLTPDGAVAAQVTAVVEGEEATVDAVFRRRDVTAGPLTAFLATLVERLRHDHPGVMSLEVQEYGGGTLAEALTATGAHVTGRRYQYRLAL